MFEATVPVPDGAVQQGKLELCLVTVFQKLHQRQSLQNAQACLS